MKKKLSKTNVSIRRNLKTKPLCKFCKKEVETILSVSDTGKKKLIRKCCKKENK